MPSITHDEIRHHILKILYNFKQENPGYMHLDRKKMQEALNVPEKKMDFNMLYLKEKGLVNVLSTLASPWTAAEITAFGIDVIEHEEEFSDQFPFIQTTIQEIHARDIYAPVVQAVESQVDQQVTTAFQKARDMTERRKDVSATLREQIKKHLNLLEKELKSKEPDAGKIQKLWKWLKRNANWVVPILTHIVLEGVKIALE